MRNIIKIAKYLKLLKRVIFIKQAVLTINLDTSIQRIDFYKRKFFWFANTNQKSIPEHEFSHFSNNNNLYDTFMYSLISKIIQKNINEAT